MVGRSIIARARRRIVGCMGDIDEGTRIHRVIVCLPDVPGRAHVGELPATVDVRLVPPEPEPVPDLAEVQLIVPSDRSRGPLLDLLDGGGGGLRVIQTTSAGVDWLIGRVPEHVTVCNARGVYDAPLAEWVVGAILAMERGLVDSRDAQSLHDWRTLEPAELSGRRVVILGLGSIGSAIADRLRPFGVGPPATASAAWRTSTTSSPKPRSSSTCCRSPPGPAAWWTGDGSASCRTARSS
jgi:hypothetical protein